MKHMKPDKPVIGPDGVEYPPIPEWRVQLPAGFPTPDLLTMSPDHLVAALVAARVMYARADELLEDVEARREAHGIDESARPYVPTVHGLRVHLLEVIQPLEYALSAGHGVDLSSIESNIPTDQPIMLYMHITVGSLLGEGKLTVMSPGDDPGEDTRHTLIAFELPEEGATDNRKTTMMPLPPIESPDPFADFRRRDGSNGPLN